MATDKILQRIERQNLEVNDYIKSIQANDPLRSVVKENAMMANFEMNVQSMHNDRPAIKQAMDTAEKSAQTASQSRALFRARQRKTAEITRPSFSMFEYGSNNLFQYTSVAKKVEQYAMRDLIDGFKG